jgi:hypothetical protein
MFFIFKFKIHILLVFREIVEKPPVTPSSVKKPKFCKKAIGPLDDPVQITYVFD